MEKDRQRRYETSNGLALDLKRYQSNQPVLARPPSTTYRIQKSWRRNRVGISACMLIVSTIVIALVFSSRSFVLERRARIKSQDLYLVAEQNRTIAESNAHLAQLNLYAADMNLAQVAIKANKIGRAARLIDRHVPAEGETDLRHWEWRYLWQQVQGNELFSLPAFDQDVFNIDHSPDGRYLAIALFDGRILIWDLHRNRKVKELKQASGDVAKCIYSPDGTTLIGFHRVEKEIPRWDARTLEEQSPLVVSDPIKSGHIRQMAFSPDNTYMAAYGIWRDSTTNSSKAMVIVWNGNTGDQLWTADVGPYSWHAGSVCFSADGKHLLIGDANSGLSRYKSLTGELEQKWPAHEGQSISALAVSPNGKILASGSAYSSGIIHLWDIDTGEALATLEGHEAWISWLEFSADGKTMASASADQTARIWDIENLTTQAIFKGHRDEIYTLSLDPKLPRLVTGSKDGVISVWNTQAEEREKQHLSREIAFERFYFSPSGKHLFIPDEMKNIVEHNPRTLEPGKVVPEFGKSSSLVFSPDSKLVFVAKPEPATDIYRLETMAFERTLEGVYPVQYIPDSNFLLTIRPQAREAVIWDVHDWKIIGTYTLPDSIRNNFFSIYNQLAAIEVEAGRVSILRVSLDHELIPLTEFKAHRRLLSGLAFSPNGEFLATTSMTGFGFLWNTDNWTQIMSLRGHSLGIHDVAFSPDSRRVLTTSSGQDAIILWDTTSHQEVMTISANGNLFHNVNLLAEGRTLVATTNTGGAVLYVWRAPTWDQITAEEAERNANE
ncbi:MAG: WD40 repeat domain-containing protein [Verrucomicrobia bacterium]|nr:WD40 repeat domain-containing protein [Verrucomicrobiota bacterium]